MGTFGQSNPLRTPSCDDTSLHATMVTPTCEDFSLTVHRTLFTPTCEPQPLNIALHSLNEDPGVLQNTRGTPSIQPHTTQSGRYKTGRDTGLHRNPTHDTDPHHKTVGDTGLHHKPSREPNTLKSDWDRVHIRRQKAAIIELEDGIRQNTEEIAKLKKNTEERQQVLADCYLAGYEASPYKTIPQPAKGEEHHPPGPGANRYLDPSGTRMPRFQAASTEEIKAHQSGTVTTFKHLGYTFKE